MPAPTVEQTTSLYSYRIIRASTGAYKGDLRGVTSTPVIGMSLNDGFSVLALEIDHYPSELTWGDLVQVRLSDGTTLGSWKFESKITDSTIGKDGFTVSLTPMVSELTTTDFNANYTVSATQYNAALGIVDPSVWSGAAIAQTPHLTAGTIQSVGAASGYAFNNSTPKAALDQQVVFGGPNWWWFCDDSVVSIRNTTTFTHHLTKDREVSDIKITEHIQDAFNVIEVIGGQADGSTIALRAIASDANPANPLSTVSLGRRVAPVYNDSSLLTQADVNLLASNLLAFHERAFFQIEMTVSGYAAVIKPGQGVSLRIPSPDPTKGNYVTLGPYLVIKSERDVQNRSYKVTLSDIVSPFSKRPQNATKQYIDKAMQNPVRTAVSPDGSTGYVSGGVTGGTTGGGGGIVSPPSTATPGIPTGLAATSAIEAVQAPENASITMSCSARPVAESIVTYQYRYRRTGTTNWSIANGPAGGVLITSLLQGTGYDMQVQAINSGGTMSGFSATVTITTAQASAPTTPTGFTAFTGLTSVLLQWNLLSAGDVDAYEVWRYTGASVAGSPAAGAVMIFSGNASIANIGSLTTGQTYTFWLRAHNASGLYSPWSAYLQAFPRSAITADIGSGQVTTTLIAALAVATANINDLAVTNAKVNDMAVSKLTAGTITAGVVVGGYFQSAALVDSTHAGWRADATSIKLYDGSGTNYGAPSGAGVTAELRNNGSAFFKGTIAAASLLTGAITSAAAVAVPAIPGSFTGFQLDPTNGLRFFNAGTLTSQFQGSGVNVYAGAIDGATITGSTISGGTITGTNVYAATLATAVNTGTWPWEGWMQQGSYISLYGAGSIQFHPDTGSAFTTAGVIQAGYVSSHGYIQISPPPAGSLSYYFLDSIGLGLNIWPSWRLQLDIDSAAKPGSNAWTVTSDKRTKVPSSLAPFEDGLAVLRRVHPTHYRYNGLGNTPDETKSKKTNIGIVADDHLDVLPYCISTYQFEGTDYYGFNSHALTYVMLNALKQLDDRMTALETKLGVTPPVLK